MSGVITRDLSVKELAEEWSVSVSHVYDLLAEGHLTGFKLGRSMRIHRESANALRNKTAAFTPPASFDAA